LVNLEVLNTARQVYESQYLQSGREECKLEGLYNDTKYARMPVKAEWSPYKKYEIWVILQNVFWCAITDVYINKTIQQCCL